MTETISEDKQESDREKYARAGSLGDQIWNQTTRFCEAVKALRNRSMVGIIRRSEIENLPRIDWGHVTAEFSDLKEIWQFLMRFSLKSPTPWEKRLSRSEDVDSLRIAQNEILDWIVRLLENFRHLARNRPDRLEDGHLPEVQDFDPKLIEEALCQVADLSVSIKDQDAEPPDVPNTAYYSFAPSASPTFVHKGVGGRKPGSHRSQK